MTLDWIQECVSNIQKLNEAEQYQDATTEERDLWETVLSAIAEGDVHSVGEASDMARLALRSREVGK